MPKTNHRSDELHTLLTQLNLTRVAEVCADVALRAAIEQSLARSLPLRVGPARMGTAHAATYSSQARVSLDCQWRKPFGPSRSVGSLPRCNYNWSA